MRFALACFGGLRCGLRVFTPSWLFTASWGYISSNSSSPAPSGSSPPAGPLCHNTPFPRNLVTLTKPLGRNLLHHVLHALSEDGVPGSTAPFWLFPLLLPRLCFCTYRFVQEPTTKERLTSDMLNIMCYISYIMSYICCRNLEYSALSTAAHWLFSPSSTAVLLLYLSFHEETTTRE